MWKSLLDTLYFENLLQIEHADFWDAVLLL